ncbi:MAG: ClpXP protease specificity-enhancing factor SspB [Polyangiaceae bacterium]
MSPPTKPKKKDVALALIEQSSIFLHLDPRRDQVVVPRSFMSQPELILQFGLQMRIPIRDLDIGDEAISGTLSFNARPFWCRIPWAAVFAIVDPQGRGVAWPEDAPPGSRLAGAGTAPAQKTGLVDTPSKVNRRAHLRAVPASSSSDSADAAVDGDAGALGDASDAGASTDGQPGTCAECATPWSEDASSCPVCGASRADAFRPDASAATKKEAVASEPPEHAEPAAPPKDAVESTSASVESSSKSGGGQGAGGEPSPQNKSESEPTDPEPPEPPAPKRPHLRLVKG